MSSADTKRTKLLENPVLKEEFRRLVEKYIARHPGAVPLEAIAKGIPRGKRLGFRAR